MGTPASTVNRFRPLYWLAFLKTITMSLTSAGTSSLLILELHYPAWVAGIVSASYNMGFVVFLLIWSHLPERMPRQRALRILLSISVLTGAMRLLPLTNNTNLVIFGTFHFLEGGVSGLFWAILQSYTLVALKDGTEARNAYLAGYNLGWNSGIIAAYGLGTVLVLFTGTNTSVFWANFFVSVMMAAVIFAMPSDGLEKAGNAPETGDPENFQREDPVKACQITDVFSPAFIFVLLLVHSFADGALLVLGPLKIQELNLDSPYVYLLSLAKYACQTVTSTLGAKISEKNIHWAFQACPLIIAAAWAVIGVAPELIMTLIAAIVSGAAQGILYAVGLKTISNCAQKTNNTQYFSLFQITQGGGRGIGPFVMGYVGEANFLAGTGIIVAFGTFMGCAAIARQHSHHE